MLEQNSNVNLLAGINISEFDKTVLEIGTIIEDLQKNLSEIEIAMLNAKDCYQSESAKSFFESFDSFKPNFELFMTNVKIYENDLKKVKFRFLNIDEDVVKILKDK